MPLPSPPVILPSSLWKGSISIPCSKTLVRRSRYLWGPSRCHTAMKHRRHSTSNLPHSSAHTTSPNQMRILHSPMSLARVRCRPHRVSHQHSLAMPFKPHRRVRHLRRCPIMAHPLRLMSTTVAYILACHQEQFRSSQVTHHMEPNISNTSILTQTPVSVSWTPISHPHALPREQDQHLRPKDPVPLSTHRTHLLPVHSRLVPVV